MTRTVNVGVRRSAPVLQVDNGQEDSFHEPFHVVVGGCSDPRILESEGIEIAAAAQRLHQSDGGLLRLTHSHQLENVLRRSLRAEHELVRRDDDGAGLVATDGGGGERRRGR